ncbi:MFS transporter [Mesorhizobium sp. CO1-1-8]|uniref:MFS transporter n=1 Tax=Mesorhizobium sp. CO1-1-8 TaxID=2876631 RepID=UPI001CD13EEE|nr:MFS transporter [Mesorhizobium sp. CO1-1-8]MBZ9772274.1 MFS transporter [Mesorhizobium sp. CO1-1-8]
MATESSSKSLTVGRPGRPVLYAMLLFMQCARSMFIVLISWFTLQITGKTTAVGGVLICWQVLALTIGPLVGPHLDRFQRRLLFGLGETTHAAAVLLLAVAARTMVPESVPLLILYGCACLASFGSLLSYPSSQALLQRVGANRLTRTVAFSIFYAQVGNIAGAALAGLCLPIVGIAGGFSLCAMSSLIAILFTLILAVDEEGIRRTRQGRHAKAVIVGLARIVRDPRLRIAACALMLAYASAHASNALLAGFARYDLKLPANLYGWLAAMYSGGGLLGSFAFAGWFSKIEARIVISVGLVAISLATAMLSTAQSLLSAVVWQGLIGLSFMMVRAAGDVMVLRGLSNRMVGRVRSNIEAGIGLVAIIVYLIASLSEAAPRQTFLAIGCLFGLATCGILWMQRRQTYSAGRCTIMPRKLAGKEGPGGLR